MSKPFPIVGIGASAGGIEALQGFFSTMPIDSGMAFVIVTHLSPERESLLHELVGRYTDIPVEIIRDGTQVRVNVIYVLPENAIVEIESGVLLLRRPNAIRRERKPVDIFLSALARDHGEYAAGVILSGGDGDGTLGIKALKERDGLTLAQTSDGNGPRHPSMPQSAIATGLIDFAISVEDMSVKLLDFARNIEMIDVVLNPANNSSAAQLIDRARQDIYALLRNQLGHDFKGYKVKTFNRRVHRRMQVLQIETISGYVERLKQDPAEVTALFRDLLINVTAFFRDADAFEALKEQVVPKLFEGRGAEDTVRIWVPGCATGEEVFSIAILIREHMGTLRALPRVQIFATDIDDRALAIARAARYPEGLLDSVSPERRQRFFTIDGGSSVLTKDVRDLCIFSPHSVTRDPPFSRMDLVSCRNLLIYFGHEYQNQVIPTFHYALRPGGYLFLGTSENISQFGDLFTPIDKKQRLFRRIEDGTPALRLPILVNGLKLGPFSSPRTGPKSSSGLPLRHIVDAQVIERFSPPHVVVNGEGDVVYYSSRTGKYLEAPPGSPSRQLLAMARKGLRLDLRAVLRESAQTRQPALRENVALDLEDDLVQMLTITVEPMMDRSEDEPLYLVLFTETGSTLNREDVPFRWGGPPDDAVQHIEREMRETRDRLQSTIEEYETALEELKSSNEELVSVNEELQSTNEELEASKEELQSLNEELQTVNIELISKVEALDQSNSDLRNLFESTEIATVFLDRQRLIRNYTPPASGLFNILPSDRGRPLTDLSSRIVYPDLHDDIRKTLETGVAFEHKVVSDTGETHLLARVRPYKGLGNQVEGVVVTFVDVSVITQAEAHQRVLIAELNHRVKNMLAVVIGITRQTLKRATSPGVFATALIGRLHSMGRAYELIARENWTETSIVDLVNQELDPFGLQNFTFSGPSIRLGPKPSLSLSMILHELATNAMTYGALSVEVGRVSLSWSKVTAGDGSDHIQMIWSEHDGPPIAVEPKPGFGLTLVTRETAYTLSGTAHAEFKPEGLVMSITFPSGL